MDVDKASKADEAQGTKRAEHSALLGGGQLVDLMGGTKPMVVQFNKSGGRLNVGYIGQASVYTRALVLSPRRFTRPPKQPAHANKHTVIMKGTIFVPPSRAHKYTLKMSVANADLEYASLKKFMLEFSSNNNLPAHCLVCKVLFNDGGNGVNLFSCSLHDSRIQKEFGGAKPALDAQGICYWCLAPQSICPFKKDMEFNARSCVARDVSLVILYLINENKHLREQVFHVMRLQPPKDAKQLIEYAGFACRFLGNKTINLTEIVWVVKKLVEGWVDSN